MPLQSLSLSSGATSAANSVAEPAAATTIMSAPVVATCSRAAAAANHVPEPAVTATATDDVASTLRIITSMSPLPRAAPRTGKRCTQSAELLTSSPNKKMLEKVSC